MDDPNDVMTLNSFRVSCRYLPANSFCLRHCVVYTALSIYIGLNNCIYVSHVFEIAIRKLYHNEIEIASDDW